MKPDGWVVWLLAGGTLAVPAGVAWVLSGRRARTRATPAAAPPKARMLPAPPRAALDEYTGDQPASGAAWAVGPAADDPGGR